MIAAALAVLMHVVVIAIAIAMVGGDRRPKAPKTDPPAGCGADVLVTKIHPEYMRRTCFPSTYQDKKARVRATVVGKFIVKRKKVDCVDYRLHIEGCKRSDGEPYPMHCSIKFFSPVLTEEEKKLPPVLMDEEDAIVVEQIDGVPVDQIPLLQPDQHVAADDDAPLPYTGIGVEQDEADATKGAAAAAAMAIALVAAYQNDNKPLPENMDQRPGGDDPVWEDGYSLPGICPREVSRSRHGTQAYKGCLKGYPFSARMRSGIFLHFPPLEYWDTVIIPATNLADPGLHLTRDELLCWVALRLLMATQKVGDVRDWFSFKKKPCLATGVPVHLNTIMSGNRFFRIGKALSFSMPDANDHAGRPDRFREQRPMQEAWNKNMERSYTPGEKVVVDESVMRWLTQRTCPGWMCLPRKPWQFGGESHTIADKDNCVIFGMEYSEGKDRPTGATREFEREYGQGVVSMLLRLCKSIFSTARTVHLDSGFCVLLGIVALGVNGLFANAQIKKRRCVQLFTMYLFPTRFFFDMPALTTLCHCVGL